MAQKGTGYIAKVTIESENGAAMADLRFSLSFYVHQRQRITLDKSELVHVVREQADHWYARIDSHLLGEGRVRCEATVWDGEPAWPGGRRPIIVDVVTGLVVGRQPCIGPGGQQTYYDQGIRLRIEWVNDLPDPDGTTSLYPSTHVEYDEKTRTMTIF